MCPLTTGPLQIPWKGAQARSPRPKAMVRKQDYLAATPSLSSKLIHFSLLKHYPVLLKTAPNPPCPVYVCFVSISGGSKLWVVGALPKGFWQMLGRRLE